MATSDKDVTRLHAASCTDDVEVNNLGRHALRITVAGGFNVLYFHLRYRHKQGDRPHWNCHLTLMTCAEKAPRMVETPIRAVGLNLSTASRRVF